MTHIGPIYYDCSIPTVPNSRKSAAIKKLSRICACLKLQLNPSKTWVYVVLDYRYSLAKMLLQGRSDIVSQSTIFPPLKKFTVDKDQLPNYRPTSNRSVAFKTTECRPYYQISTEMFRSPFSQTRQFSNPTRQSQAKYWPNQTDSWWRQKLNFQNRVLHSVVKFIGPIQLQQECLLKLTAQRSACETPHAHPSCWGSVPLGSNFTETGSFPAKMFDSYLIALQPCRWKFLDNETL